MDDSRTTWHVEVEREDPRAGSSSNPFARLQHPPRWRYLITYMDHQGIIRYERSHPYPSEQQARAVGETKARDLFKGPAASAAHQKREAPPPSENMPTEIRALYEDARRVSEPRSANALLRIACEDLCRIKGILRGKDGFKDTIRKLQKSKDISTTLRDALDSIRITGNDAVHGKETDYDIPLEKLFNLVNIIVDEWHRADEVASVYEALPDDDKVPRPPDSAAQ